MTRLPVVRPTGSDAATFACPGCDVLLIDGPHYSWCPACELPVDWVDLAFPVWACPACDVMVNDWDEPDGCVPCDGPMRQLWWPREDAVEQASPNRTARFLELAFYACGLVALGFILFNVVGIAIVAFDPRYKYQVLGLLAPVLMIPVVVAAARLLTALQSLGGIYSLIRDRRTRVIHGFEHATIAVLERTLGMKNLGGRAHFNGFEIQACTESASLACQQRIRDATIEAIRRIKAGETDLTLTPECGTSLFVAGLMQSIWVTALALAVFFTTASAVAVLSIVVAIAAFTFLLRDRLGIIAQRYLTVSTDFETARPVSVVRQTGPDGSCVKFGVLVEVVLDPPG